MNEIPAGVEIGSKLNVAERQEAEVASLMALPRKRTRQDRGTDRFGRNHATISLLKSCN